MHSHTVMSFQSVKYFLEVFYIFFLYAFSCICNISLFSLSFLVDGVRCLLRMYACVHSFPLTFFRRCWFNFCVFFCFSYNFRNITFIIIIFYCCRCCCLPRIIPLFRLFPVYQLNSLALEKPLKKFNTHETDDIAT